MVPVVLKAIAALLLMGTVQSSLAQIRIMLTPTPSNEDMDQVSVLSSEAFRKNFGQAMSVTSHGSKVDLRQTLTFDDSVGIYDVTAESSISASDVCDAVAAASDKFICETDVQVFIDSEWRKVAAVPISSTTPSQWDPLVQINLQKGWDAGFTGSSAVRVCIIDTGVDYTHPDLAANMWLNPKEAAGAGAAADNSYTNGIDDDGNGIIDDIHGAAIIHNVSTSDPMDYNGHGTFVAGVIGATGSNPGVRGVNKAVSLMACRFMDANGQGSLFDAIQCIVYCLNNEAHIITNSWGSTEHNEGLQRVMDRAEAAGVLFVASAGNSGINTDLTIHYPSTLNNSNIMSVGATDSKGNVWRKSNYGKKTVQMMAPGVNIVSTGLAGTYIRLDGTSMAAPFVSGAAALLLHKFMARGWPIATTGRKGLASVLRSVIIRSARSLGTADEAKCEGGILDVYTALSYVLPPSDTDLTSQSSDFHYPPEAAPETDESMSGALSRPGNSSDGGAPILAPDMTTTLWPLSASEQAFATAVQAEAAATLQVPVNASQAVFGLSQLVVSSSARGPALVRAEVPMGTETNGVRGVEGITTEAPGLAPMTQGVSEPDTAIAAPNKPAKALA